MPQPLPFYYRLHALLEGGYYLEMESLGEMAQQHLSASARDKQIAALSQILDHHPYHVNVVAHRGHERGVRCLSYSIS